MYTAEVEATRLAVRRDLAALGQALAPEGLVLVACSGGADSLALAAALAYEAGRVGRSTRSRGHRIRAGAVIVDHGLQPGSAEVASAAAATCAALGLEPVEIATVRVQADGTGPEAAARAARYEALGEAATRLGARAVLLGHTLDDNAEQVLLSLARGSGARALAGIPPTRGIYRRPMLGLRRTTLRSACEAQGIDWWDDPTNSLPTTGPRATDTNSVPLRTRVRHELIPLLAEVLGPGSVESLARSATLLRNDADALDALAAEVYHAASLQESVVDVDALAAAPAALRSRALRQFVEGAGICPKKLNHAHLEALDALVTKWRGQGDVHLPSGATVGRTGGRLTLKPGQVAQPRHD